MKNKQKMRRIFAVALVILLVGAMVLSIVVSAVARAEGIGCGSAIRIENTAPAQ